MLNLQTFCVSSDQEPAWLKFEKNWLSEKWIGGWIDLNRTDIPRIGLGNTNNACESWFKTLLRVYLAGFSYSYPQVLKLILETVLPVSDSKFAHSIMGVGRRRQKPTEKAQEDVEFETDLLEETATLFEGKNKNKFIVVNGKKHFSVSLSPMKCICFYYSWYGKKCKHITYTERIKVPKDLPQVMELAKAARQKKKDNASKRKKKVPNTTRKAGRKHKEHFSEKKIIAKKLGEEALVSQGEDVSTSEESDSKEQINPKATPIDMSVPTQEISKTDLLSKKKNLPTGNHFSEHKEKPKMPKEKEENANKKDKSGYQQFKDISI